MKEIVLLLMRVYLLPFIIFYLLSMNKDDITEDVSAMKEKTGVNYSER